MGRNNNNRSSSSDNRDLRKKIEDVAVKIFPSYKLKCFTTINFLVIVAMYIICNIVYYAGNKSWLCVNHFFGSHYGPDIGQDYGFHRLFTPLYLH